MLAPARPSTWSHPRLLPLHPHSSSSYVSIIIHSSSIYRALVSKLALLAIIMVFLAQETIPVPTKDILSWIFDDVPYDEHKPVRGASIPASDGQLNST